MSKSNILPTLLANTSPVNFVCICSGQHFLMECIKNIQPLTNYDMFWSVMGHTGFD